MDRISKYSGSLLAGLYNRVNIWSVRSQRSIDLKVKEPVPSLVTKELVDDLYEKVLTFLKANKFSGDEILQRKNNIFAFMPSYVKGLNEKLLLINSGGGSTSSEFEACLLKINGEDRLFMVLSREGSSSADTVCLYNIKFPVDGKVIKEAISYLLSSGSYELLGRVNLRQEFNRQNRIATQLSTQNYLEN